MNTIAVHTSTPNWSIRYPTKIDANIHEDVYKVNDLDVRAEQEKSTA